MKEITAFDLATIRVTKATSLLYWENQKSAPDEYKLRAFQSELDSACNERKALRESQGQTPAQHQE
jgi:hypothetical protein